MTRILSSPVTSALKAFGSFVDNVIEKSGNDLGLLQIVQSLAIEKKQGPSVDRILIAALHAPIVLKDSTWAFCQRFSEQYQIGEKDVIYRFLRRQDIAWARLTTKVATRFIKLFHRDIFANEDEVAVVFDDTLTQRFGKKVVGSAKHWDHGLKKSIRSHQIVTGGLAFAKGFVPLASQVITGKTKRYLQVKEWEDGRSEVAKAYTRGIDQSKNDFFASMVKRIAKSKVMPVKWVLADAWFGTKANIKAVLDSGLHGIILMKRNKLKYRYQGRMLEVKEIYKLYKRRMQKVQGGLFRGVAVEVELNVGTKKAPDWRTVQLIMSRPIHNQNPNGWIACVCTDLEASMEKVLRVYSLRWSIEVFFKECKQNLGWLKNQSGDYVSTYSSLHLSMLRFLILQHGALTGGCGLCDVRNKTRDQLVELNYLGKIWPLIMGLIFGILSSFKKKYGAVIEEISADLRAQLDEFIEQAFRINENIPEAFPDGDLDAVVC